MRVLHNIRIASLLTGVVAVFVVFQLLSGGLGYVALSNVSTDAEAMYRTAVVNGNASMQHRSIWWRHAPTSAGMPPESRKTEAARMPA
ncbi:MAG: Tar ligand binding domain-containing protein [Burkholderiaceae bacterium]|nr:Tar ligand binding domain-containing protein [Burkholderiaceae bacterium]